MKRLGALLLTVVAAVALAACGGDGGGGSSSSGSTGSSGSPSKLTIFAAASLTDPFTTIGKQYEAANPGVKVTFNFAGSNTLVTQIGQGAPADAFASADTQNMDKLTSQSLVDSPTTFTKNTVTVIIPAANPGKIENLEDLANDGVKIAAGAEDVPIGTYTQEILANMATSSGYGSSYQAAVKGNIVSQETSVSGIVQKVELGEVDAGYVYVSDALAAGDKVKSIAIPETYNVVADYPIAVVKESKNQAGANSFIKYVLSADGQKTLSKYGFLPVE
jgi:molybdate transport system substrate-binding protein